MCLLSLSSGERETERETDRQTERDRQRETERKTERQTEERDRQRQKGLIVKILLLASGLHSCFIAESIDSMPISTLIFSSSSSSSFFLSFSFSFFSSSFFLFLSRFFFFFQYCQPHHCGAFIQKHSSIITFFILFFVCLKKRSL